MALNASIGTMHIYAALCITLPFVRVLMPEKFRYEKKKNYTLQHICFEAPVKKMERTIRCEDEQNSQYLNNSIS